MPTNSRTASLVIRPEKLGDLVISTPVFSALKKAYPDDELHVLTDERHACILESDPNVDRLIVLPWFGRKSSQRPSLFQIVEKLKPYNYRRAAILYANWEPWNWVMVASRIKDVAQIGGTLSACVLGHKMVRRQDYLANPRHYRDWYMDVAGLLGAPTSTDLPHLYSHDSETDSIRQQYPFLNTPLPLLLLHLGGSPEGENYSQSALSDLAPRLAEKCGARILVTGTSADAAKWQNPSPEWIEDRLLGRLKFRELMAVIRLCRMGVMNSTGVIHLAAALGMPVVGLYGSIPGNDNNAWGPLGPMTSVISPPVEKYESWRKNTKSGFLEEIIFRDQILERVAEVWNATNHPGRSEHPSGHEPSRRTTT